ncbi:T9SS type A sorting domain-containing protein [Bergeyella sp. RCAD1439]|uniref:T9SS type A sorting domain-containing protein n=1 Tax=Bergeyella anatis TaxID=3113737 RepID=UPI002E19867F|nr:T9SS type A sorting domain-containing protein [Bergeyella sp. RCAD1439]
MKKFYSLLAVVAMSVAVNAQGTETFETQSALTTAYANGSFEGETAGVTVAYVHSRDQGDSPISGKGIMLRRSDEPSSVEFTIPNGVGDFTFEYRKAFTGGNERKLAVLVDGEEVKQTPAFGAGSGAASDVYKETVTINKVGEVKVKITYPQGTATGNRQVTIDNVSWTAPSLSVLDVVKERRSLVKNTQVGAELVFAATADVKIVGMNGQVVRAFSVKADQVVNVSDLAKGVYLVTGVVDGEAVSQKIIKK